MEKKDVEQWVAKIKETWEVTDPEWVHETPTRFLES